MNMLHLSSRNLRIPKNQPKRHSVSIIEGELTKQPCSPFSKDRFFNAEKKTPTKSPTNRPPPLPTKKRESPYKSPISTPKKEKRFTVEHQVLDAPDIIDNAPNNILSFNKKNELAVALGENVYIWRKDGDVEYFMEATSAIDAVAWVDQETLAITTQGDVEVWNTNSKQIQQKLKKHSGRATSIEIGEHRIATAGTDLIINITDLNTNKTEALSGHHHEIVAISWSPDGVYLASCDTNGTLILWGNKKRKKFRINFPVSSITWVSQTMIAIGGSDPEGTLRLLNIICPDDEVKIIKTGMPISSLAWQPQKGLLVAHRNAPYEWDLYGRDFTLIESYQEHNADILHITSTADGTCIATIAIDEKLVLWYFKDRRPPLPHASSNSVFVQLR